MAQHRASGGRPSLLRGLPAAAAGLLLVGMAYLDGPPPAYTGGFGELTCRQCHFDGPLNAPGGQLALQGIPASYRPGEVYPVVVQLTRPEMQRGGFQLSARYAEGPREGQQAGTFSFSGEGLTLGREKAVQYISHTRAGTLPLAPDTIRWTFQWRAPEAADQRGPVVFHVAANAANGDDSEFGDHIYTLEVGSDSE